MFSAHVVESGTFLDLPLSTQAAYFHLCMHADDDGFIDNARQVVRMIGASEKDLRLLLEKEYFFSFDSGILAVRHWLVNNTIRCDRYQPTQYLQEKDELAVEKNNTYSLSKDGTPAVREEIQNTPPAVNHAEAFDLWWQCYPLRKGKAAAQKAFDKVLRSGVSVETLIDAVEEQKRSRQWQDPRYIPHPATWLNRGSWEDEEYCPAAENDDDEETYVQFDAEAYHNALLATLPEEVSD